jgi:hypothetical protein
MTSIVTISFGKSKSKLYKRAVSIASMFSSYTNLGTSIYCSINSVKEFIKVQEEFNELIHIVAKWKGTIISLYGKEYKNNCDLYNFYNEIRENAGKYAIMIRDTRTTVSLAAITYEDLPLPIVFYPNIYGAFFAFAEDIGEDIYFCECERQAITNYVKLRSQMPLTNYTNSKVNPLGGDYFPPIVAQRSLEYKDNPLMHIRFKENLCFRCNKKIPKMTYCHPMYGGQFKQHFGWYIQQEYFKLGIDPHQIYKGNVLPEECTPQLYDNILRISDLSHRNQEMQLPELQDAVKKLYDEICKSIENTVRVQLGYRKIGDSWISETILFHIIESLYPEKEILRHYRPTWLEGLELDIFIPEEKLAFEYQGIQHFIAVEHWGGQKQLDKQQEHDARKKRLCEEFEIRLICINYDDPLTNEFVKSIIINTGHPLS